MTIEQMRAIPGTGPEIESSLAGAAAVVRGRVGAGRGDARRALPSAPRPRSAAAGRPTARQRLQHGVRRHPRGILGTGGRGESVGLLPGSRWAEYKLPPEC